MDALREIERRLTDVSTRGGTSGVREVGRRKSRFRCYAAAAPWEVIARLGTEDVAHVLTRSDPPGYARWRARGWWARDDLETSSAYERLAELAEAGKIP